ncbi:MAG: FIST signal transduction protein [Chloroflexota bacterium]
MAENVIESVPVEQVREDRVIDGAGPVRMAAIGRGADWRDAFDQASREMLSVHRPATPSLAFVFASAAYRAAFPDLLRRVKQTTRAGLVVGCTGQGIIGPEQEIEDQPSLSLLALHLPGATLRPFHLTQALLVQAQADPTFWHAHTGVDPVELNAWLLLADPFHLDCEALLESLGAAYPGVPIVGGLASGDPGDRSTALFLDEQVLDQGAVAVALGGQYTVRAVVSQGCDPIGDAWIITAAHGNVIDQISQRPAYEVLVETVRALPPEKRERASRNLLVGLAMDEYKDSFGRGDFLIRNLMGADPAGGAVAINAYPRVGQTIQFQIRDAAAADEDLRHLLNVVHQDLSPASLAGALLCSCNGRGQGLFGVPDHDARAVAQQLGPVPLAGFFCNGEIGPVGKKNLLHGFTASLALFVPTTGR